MKNIKIILTVISVLFLFNQCTDTYYLDEKYAGGYKSYGEELFLLTREYYDRYFKYPKTIDRLLKFEYEYSIYLAQTSPSKSDRVTRRIINLLNFENNRKSKTSVRS